MSISAYVARRLILLVVVLLGVSVLTFVMVRVVPSDPAALYVGANARPGQVAEARQILGLDRPAYVQFGLYMKGLVTGQWGDSLRTHRPVLRDIGDFLPATLELIICALFVSSIAGVLLGVVAAKAKGAWIDQVLRFFSISGVSLPVFWLALVLQVVFFRYLHLLPVAGQNDILVVQQHPITPITHMALVDALITGNWSAFTDGLRHLILPVLALSAYSAGVVMRMTRSAMLETLGQDYIRMDRAMGLPPRLIFYKAALKNALGPVLTVIGLNFAYSLTGAFFIELIFAWPGLGMYATTSVLSLDYPAIVGVTVIVALVYVIVNMLVDLLQAWLDPRIVLD